MGFACFWIRGGLWSSVPLSLFIRLLPRLDSLHMRKLGFFPRFVPHLASLNSDKVKLIPCLLFTFSLTLCLTPFPGLLVGLDERNRAAADSLASVLAVYDGFCNLKQVRFRPSQILPRNFPQNKKAKKKKNLSPFVYTSALLFSASRSSAFRFVSFDAAGPGVQSSDLFSWISLSKMLSDPCVKFCSGPAARQILRFFQSLQLLCRIT